MDKETTYSEAYEELQQIIAEMEHSEISIDQLDLKIKRASELLKICKEKLYNTEKNVQEILKDM